MGSHKQGNFKLAENNQDIRTSGRSNQNVNGKRPKTKPCKKSKNGERRGSNLREKGVENQIKVGAWNADESATQNFEKIVNRVAITIEDLKMDILGIVEANIYPNTITDGLKIAGYNMEIGRGVEKEVGANARVIVYISKDLDYKRRRDLEELSEMPTV